MHISLDRNGNAVATGEGMHRLPIGAEQQDVMMNSAGAIAELMQERENAEIIANNRFLQRQEERQTRQEKERVYEEMLALDYENYQREARNNVYGGENPMAYIAALQTMAGAVEDYHQPLSGYALSNDGRDSYGPQLSGYSPLHGSMGDWLSDMTASLKDAAESAEDIAASISPIVDSVQDIFSSEPDAPAPAPVAAPVTTQVRTVVKSASSTFTKFLNAKVGPVPVPLLVLAGLGAGIYLYKRR